MTAELRLGLVGCGRLAERGYVPAIADAEGVRLAAVADPVEERRRRAAPSVPGFADAAELVAAGAADALVLATPAAAHVPDARIAASAGLPCLIEKPPATTLGGALELARLAPAPRIAFNRRFVPALATVRAAVPADEPAELELVLLTRSASWRAYEPAADALLNLGSHLVDLVRWLSGSEIGRVRGDVGERRAQLELELTDGRGRARIECATDARFYRESVVLRVDGRRRAGYAAGGLGDALREAMRPAGRGSLVPSLARQLDAFARAVRGEPEPTLAAVPDGVAAIAAIEAARASAAGGGAWEPVEPLSRLLGTPAQAG